MLSLKNIHVFKLLLSSNPRNYFLTHLLILVGTVLYYVFTLKYNPIPLYVITIVAHVACILTLIVLAFIDPGIVKKTMEGFEYADLHSIPLNPHIANGSMRVFDKQYSFPIKTHFLKIKSCRTCLTFRAPRTVHCF